MNRIIVASILGLISSALAAHGQAAVLFDNYGGEPVRWTTDALLAPTGRAGTPVMAADNFKVNLLWQYDGFTGDAGLAVPVGDGGYFSGPLVTLGPYPGYEPITFTVPAWDGADYASSGATGSVTWMEAILVPGPPGGFHMPALYVEYVPEPSLLALAGLGIAGVVFARRRA